MYFLTKIELNSKNWQNIPTKCLGTRLGSTSHVRFSHFSGEKSPRLDVAQQQAEKAQRAKLQVEEVGEPLFQPDFL